ncbi:MAG: molybdopterin-binding/glycosyltransferase family 2 protein, partial [Proteobacteria bacterium]|nr:molybdopterin-binding/glycosyltransferase family 2 protein [Pseudomonadota bacterium]
DEVITARLEAGDVHEDEAATRIAGAAAGSGVRAAAAFTGRVNLIADVAGIALLDEARVGAINGVDEAVTLATVANYSIVQPRQILATCKIIPFAAPGAAVDAATGHAGRDGPLVRVAPFRDQPAGLVQTTSGAVSDKALEKTTQSVRARLERYGAHLQREIRCRHDEAEVRAAITALLDDGCAPILVVGASAIVDRRDVIPAAIVGAGGGIDRFGMPVDPGNLLLLAHHGDVTVIGAPGCARSPKFNGFDNVLARVLAGVAVSPPDIAAMGAGGLLTELAARPQPREGAEDAAQSHRVAALILAGGLSRRTGDVNKLLATLDGAAMVAQVADTVLATSARPLVVVTGHQAQEVRAALAGRDIAFTHNPRFAEGLSTSLRQGLRALAEIDPEADGALVCLGDMPRLRPQHLEKLIAAFASAGARAVCVPTFGGRRGNPVLWGRAFFAEISDVSGDVGARHLIGAYEEAVREVAMDDDAIFVDVDTPEALAAAGAIPAARAS